ncbi:MAG: hemolysin family protein [Actinomycetota bacterium]|nr:hemolysin family protein [Actinomycetota bacterium]
MAGEFGIVAVDRGRIQELADGGSRRASSTLLALKTLSFQLSGAQLGITLSSLIVGFIAEPTIGRLLEPAVGAIGLPEATTPGVAIALALAIATAAQMVVGELVPKNIAIAKPVETALRVATPLRLVNAFFRPLILFLNTAANFTVRLLGIKPQEELTQVRSLDELDYLIRSSRQEGVLEEEEFSLLARSISLENKAAADALTPRTGIVALSREATLTDLREVALEKGFSRFPVYGKDLDDIIGIVHVKDCYRFEPEQRPETKVTDVMQDPLVVPESHNLASLLVEIRRTRKHLVVVIDEYGGTAGIITLEDILEEIVGEIEDEYDAREATTTAPPEGVYVVSGMLHPDEVKEAVGLEMAEGDYETLAGFLLALFERIPSPGEHVSYEDWEFKVVEMDGRRIAKVLVVAPPAERRPAS